jgi:type VI secretion system protein ImpH
MIVNPNQIDTDFKAVTLAAELVEQGKVAFDNFVILPLGPKKRAYAKEINEVTSYHSIYRNREMLAININREGLYDMLPEGLFHQSPASSVMITEEEMIKDIAIRREEEKQARLFFAPFETELYRLRTTIELYESRLDKKSDYDDLINIFLKEWKEFKCFTNAQMLILMHVLPVIHEQRNNIPFITNVLTIMFDAKFTLEYKFNNVNNSSLKQSNLQTTLGSGVLGVNLIAGRLTEPEEELVITIGPISASQMLKYLPGTPSAQALDVLMSYFIPLQTTVSSRFEVEPEYQKLVLGFDQDNACLGFTTYLGVN